MVGAPSKDQQKPTKHQRLLWADFVEEVGQITCKLGVARCVHGICPALFRRDRDGVGVLIVYFMQLPQSGSALA